MCSTVKWQRRLEGRAAEEKQLSEKETRDSQENTNMDNVDVLSAFGKKGRKCLCVSLDVVVQFGVNRILILGMKLWYTFARRGTNDRPTKSGGGP